MRAGLSLLALLGALLVVWLLSGRQMQAAGGAAGPASAAESQAQQLQRAIEQGAALRASEAAAQ